MVLGSLPRPEWLTKESPVNDVVLSTRTRLMRNLRGHRFPNRADSPELMVIMGKVIEAAKSSPSVVKDPLIINRSLTNAERDYLVGCRLVSPEFEWTLPGRALLLNESRTLSLMINEEDHLRVQAIVGGWDIQSADRVANEAVVHMADALDFAWAPSLGFLAASPANLGAGRRQSAMLHLIALRESRRIDDVIRALGAQKIVVRGLFGESSRAIGAFAQVSVQHDSLPDFRGAVEYLVEEERLEREKMGLAHITDHAAQVRDFVLRSRAFSLADSLRCLAWIRWAAVDQIEGFPAGPRPVDHALTALAIRPTIGEGDARLDRAQLLRDLFPA